MEAFEEWLSALDQELQLNGQLVLDEQQHCFLLFDDTLLVEIAYQSDEHRFTFKGNLEHVLDPEENPIGDQLLEANLCWSKTNGATLGVQAYSDKILLIQSTDTQRCDYNGFTRMLETFVNTFEYWLQQIPTLKTKPPAIELETIGILA